MTREILPGAQPWSHEGGPVGMLCLHGFTGNPSSMRPVAEAVAAAGYGVELPRLPGHGTTVEDMMSTGWPDWAAEADAAYRRLAARSEKVIVAGLSMGGSLTLNVGLNHPDVAGLVCINPLTQPASAELVEMAHGMLAEGTTTIPGIGSDIAKPDVVESAYSGTPLGPFLSLMDDGIATITDRYAELTCPVLIVTSRQDHVVDPANSDHLAATVTGPIERVSLERSYHVATMDFDAGVIIDSVLDFAGRIAAA